MTSKTTNIVTIDIGPARKRLLVKIKKRYGLTFQKVCLTAIDAFLSERADKLDSPQSKTKHRRKRLG